MEVLKDTIGVSAYLLPLGNIVDPDSLSALKERLESCLEHQEYRIIVDLSNVPAFNSASLDTLTDCHDKLARYGGALTLSNVSALNIEILRITGTGNYFTIADSNENVTASEEVKKPPKRLGDMLIDAGLITQDNLSQVLAIQKETGRRLGHILITKGLIKESELLPVMGEHLQVPFVKLGPGLFDPELVELLDREIIERLQVLPLFKVQNVLTLATAEPQAVLTFDEIEESTGYQVRPVLAELTAIHKYIGEAYEGGSSFAELGGYIEDDFELVEQTRAEDLAEIDQLAEGSPVINLVNGIIHRAIQDGASDIHIEPGRNKSRIRLRIDGILYEVMNPPSEMHASLVSRLKVMGNLDIAERRMPQDGRLQVSTGGRVVDLRFSSLPGIFGEKIVLRILDKNKSILNIEKLGMSDENKADFLDLLSYSNGLVLTTGPTGSGKTTTLYSAVSYLNSTEKSIVTIEDPVEYQLDIINQNQVREKTGLTFATLLRHVLRQDPDIIMVGEIRDTETAEIAIQAALTGHLVLSTLHTNSAIGAITRLINMGVAPYLLSSSLIGIIAQRLIRTVCDECKTSFVATPAIIEEYGWQDEKRLRLAKGHGCVACYDSGYKGRISIHEIVRPDSKLQKLMMSNPSREQLNAFVKESKFRTLYDDGMARVKAGMTTIEEIGRMVKQES